MDAYTSNAYRQRQIRAAIAQCNDYIAKEGAYPADLRPADVQQRLDWYVAHRAKLLEMLDSDAAA